MGKNRNFLLFDLKSFIITNFKFDKEKAIGDNISFGIRPNIVSDKEHNEVKVKLLVAAGMSQDPETFFCTIETETIFNVEDFSLINEEKENLLFEIILSVSYSTTRGALAVKAHKTILNKFPLPLINPAQFLETMLVKNKESGLG